MRTLMKVLKNLFGNNTKMSASDIAIMVNEKAKCLDTYLLNMKPTVLFENANGVSEGTISLTDSFEKYDIVVVTTNLGGNKALTPKYQSIFSIGTVEYYDTIYFQFIVATFSKKTLTFNVNGSYYSSTNHPADHKIFKIVGYK